MSEFNEITTGEMNIEPEVKKFLDQKGVEYLWSKINMQDYPNNDTLIAVINAIDENKADKTEIKQSDWNQTDETQTDYIKNKPDKMLAIQAAKETGLIAPLESEDGTIYTSENNAIYTLI